MRLFTLALLLIATSQIVEAQTAGGIHQPNEQFIREQMRRQAEQVNIDAMQRQQWDNIRTWRYTQQPAYDYRMSDKVYYNDDRIR